MKKSLIRWVGKPVQWAVGIVAGGTLLLVLLSSPLGEGMRDSMRQTVSNLFEKRSSAHATAPVIVEKLQALNRLETARQTTQHQIEAKTERGILPDFLAGEKVRLQAQAEAVAGIDLKDLKPQDIQVQGERVIIKLPTVRLFQVSLNEAVTQVYHREKGWLVFNPDKDLEREARLLAWSEARQAALQGDLLKKARTHAEENLSQLIRSFGFQSVEFAS